MVAISAVHMFKRLHLVYNYIYIIHINNQYGAHIVVRNTSMSRSRAGSRAHQPQESAPLVRKSVNVPPTQRKTRNTYYVIGPREIELSVTASRVGNIDTRAETSTANLWVDVYWLPTYEEVCAFDQNSTTTSPAFDVSANFQLMNVDTLEKKEIVLGPVLKMVGERKKWHAVLEIIGTFQQNFDLRYFPLDCQVLSINIEMGNVKDMVYIPAENMKSFFTVELDLCPLRGWTLLGAGIEFTASHPSRSKQGHSYSQAVIEFGVSRNWEVYFWRIVAILFMMQLSVLLIWNLDACEEFNDRAQLSLLLILTIVSFDSVIHDELPKVNYVTLLEKYTLQATLSIFVVTMLIAITYYAYKNDRIRDLQWLAALVDESWNTDRKAALYVALDKCICYATVATLVIRHMIFVLYCYCKRRELVATCLRTEVDEDAMANNLIVGYEHHEKTALVGHTQTLKYLAQI
eukprot:GEMP01041265.1.p1 GENE.GEMP01041265.1~~GEMP01041265.1.p1  ORF type:complete len:460 (+),score=61.49 GEMP01041265.1:147-1526(+)